MSVYLHVDLDAFFASVEQLDHPEYRGKPVIIGGLPTDRRAVVSTASYEARKHGVHSAMSIVKAYQLCPDAIYLRGNYSRYHEKSHEVMQIFTRYSPTVIQMSVDEAFIDITGTQRLFGNPVDVAKKIRDEVLKETGLTVSIGLSAYMYIAKIASGYRKPHGLTIVPRGKEEAFMLSLPLEKLWGAGSKTQERLKKAGFTSIKSIHEKSRGLLISIFGDGTGNFLYDAVRGNKDMVFGTESKTHSMSSERTYEYDLEDRYSIDTALMELSYTVLYRMHLEGCRSKTVSLKIRYEDFTTVSAQESTERYIANADDFFERCKRIFDKKYDPSRGGIRLLGVSCDNIEKKGAPVQRELFDFGDEKKAKVEQAIFAMEDKNPSIKIRKARLLTTEEGRNTRSHRDQND